MPPPSSGIADALGALARAFGELGLAWYVFGAQAAIVYGSARATKDIDVTVAADAVPVGTLLATLASHGLATRTPDPEALARTARVIPVVHAASGTPIDLVLAGPGLEPLFLSRAQPREIAGVRVPVAAPDDVIAMKILAGRPHDREDVLAILRALRDTGAIDRARETLAMLEEALGQSDLVPLLDELVTRARRR